MAEFKKQNKKKKKKKKKKKPNKPTPTPKKKKMTLEKQLHKNIDWNIRDAFNKFPDFFVQTFKIVVDS